MYVVDEIRRINAPERQKWKWKKKRDLEKRSGTTVGTFVKEEKQTDNSL